MPETPSEELQRQVERFANDGLHKEWDRLMRIARRSADQQRWLDAIEWEMKRRGLLNG